MHPKIQDIQVIGIPDARDGGGQIAHYKVPRYVKLVDGFPMTITGKVQKFLMRQQMIDELGLSLQETA